MLQPSIAEASTSSIHMRTESNLSMSETRRRLSWSDSEAQGIELRQISRPVLTSHTTASTAHDRSLSLDQSSIESLNSDATPVDTRLDTRLDTRHSVLSPRMSQAMSSGLKRVQRLSQSLTMTSPVLQGYQDLDLDQSTRYSSVHPNTTPAPDLPHPKIQTPQDILHRILLSWWFEGLVHFLILLDVAMLLTQNARTVFRETGPLPKGFFIHWSDTVRLVIFSIYIVEVLLRVKVNGFWIRTKLIEPQVKKSKADRRKSMRRSVKLKAHVKTKRQAENSLQNNLSNVYHHLRNIFSLHSDEPSPEPYIHTVSDWPFAYAILKQHELTRLGRPYMRHNWNRLDLMAILAFWIYFIISLRNPNPLSLGVTIFKAMSVMRAFRLLTATKGTNVIAASLKAAGPLLVEVGVFIAFAMVLFSIIGVQSFNGSFRRSCIYIGPDAYGSSNISLSQNCGGHWFNNTAQGYLNLHGVNAGIPHKGFLCPDGQFCQEFRDAPEGGAMSFDNVLESALQVAIIGSANGWSPLMYQMVDAESSGAAFYFLFALIILNFWLFNLLVAVITSSFSAIREEGKASAFAPKQHLVQNQVEAAPVIQIHPLRTRLQELLDKTRFFWLSLILLSIVSLALVTDNSSAVKEDIILKIQIAIIIILDVEIVLRLMARKSAFRIIDADTFDLLLAIGSSVLLIPPARNSPAAPWLTVFLLARFWRIVVAIPRMRRLTTHIFRGYAGLINMILFLLLINVVVSLMACVLLRGSISDSNAIAFTQIWNAFLGMYQILSSENWTTVLYSATSSAGSGFSAAVFGLFLSAWELVGFFVILQLFIAVLKENFEFDEEDKRSAQIKRYVHQSAPINKSASVFERWNPYRHMKVRKGSLPSAERSGDYMDAVKAINQRHKEASAQTQSIFRTVLQFVGRTKRHVTQPVHLGPRLADMGLDENMVTSNVANAEHEDTLNEQRALEIEFIRSHPTYDVTLFIFKQGHPIRSFCQRLCLPAHGDRLLGRPPSALQESLVRLVVIIAVIAGIVVAAISTPNYRRKYYLDHNASDETWYTLSMSALVTVFVLEFLIKIVADGFLLCPNAYLKSLWNIVDFMVLLSIIASTITEFVIPSTQGNSVRMLKAFRAVRLITLFSTMRSTFYSVVIAGFTSLFDASVLAVLYMIPYAIWGLQLFKGALNSCSDTVVAGQTTCMNEYMASPGVWSFPAPRVWGNPGTSSTTSVWSFDTFRSSLLILFEIVSLEGWVDVQTSLTSVNGPGIQPSLNARQWNAIFTIVYNLFGSVVILTLFLSIIIESFSERAGTAYLTINQRKWIDLKKLIRRQKPSNRPRVPRTGTFTYWCYERAINKHGWWIRGTTCLYFIQIIALLSQTAYEAETSSTVRNALYLGLMLLYTIDISVRLIGLGGVSFARNSWNIFDIIAVGGSTATTIIVLSGSDSQSALQLQKLFLVSIVFKLVQRSNRLNQLFKIAVSSLPAIGNLFMLWAAFFIVWALLFVELFGLTRWSWNETHEKNLSSFLKTLLMMSFFSVGEGWNAYMHDFAISFPRCTPSINYLNSDCGSRPAAYILFITWNVLSMYLLANMFTGVVVESFSYVFEVQGRLILSRENIRDFKRVWAQFDTTRSGYIMKDKICMFLARLSDPFDIGIYPQEHSVRNLSKIAKSGIEGAPLGRVVQGIHLDALNQALQTIDDEEIRQRRLIYERLYHECLLKDTGKGISFTNMLLMLAHYKLIDDDESLQLDELFTRQDDKRRIEVMVNLDRVRALLRRIYHRKNFLNHEQSISSNTHHQDIPDIRIDDEGGRAQIPPSPFVGSPTSRYTS